MFIWRWQHPQPYKKVAKLMDDHVGAIIDNTAQEAFWLLEHQSVYTHGRFAPPSTSIPYVLSKRGGKMTHHGPGQRIVYLMMDLNKMGLSFSEFLDLIIEWMRKVFSTCGVKVNYEQKAPGLWHKKGKLVSIGFALKKGITFHGFAVNIKNDLSAFNCIHPCGQKDAKTASLHYLGVNIELKTFDDVLLKNCPFFPIFKPDMINECE